MKKTLVFKTNEYLADIAVMYVKLHNLHWNVVGAEFKQMHEYLEVLYEGYAGELDKVAEVLRMDNERALASMKNYISVSKIQEIDDTDYSVRDTIIILLNDMSYMHDQAETIRSLALQEDCYSLVNLMEAELEEYKKNIWFLNSMLR